MIKAIGNLFLNLGRYVVEQVLAGTQPVVDLLLPVGTTAVAIAGAAPGAFPLSARQRRRLEGVVRRSTAPPRLVRRARLMLELAAGHSPNQVARQLGVLRQTVYKGRDQWRKRHRYLVEAEAAEPNDKRRSAFLERQLLDRYRLCCINFRCTQTSYSQTPLGGQGIELSCGRQILAMGDKHLSLLEHVQEFDALEGHPGRREGFEAKHRPDESFDRAMILLHQVV